MPRISQNDQEPSIKAPKPKPKATSRAQIKESPPAEPESKPRQQGITKKELLKHVKEQQKQYMASLKQLNKKGLNETLKNSNLLEDGTVESIIAKRKIK
jgi:hypothetical protein